MRYSHCGQPSSPVHPTHVHNAITSTNIIHYSLITRSLSLCSLNNSPVLHIAQAAISIQVIYQPPINPAVEEVKPCPDTMVEDLPLALPGVTRMRYIKEQCQLLMISLQRLRLQGARGVQVPVPVLPVDQALAVVAYTFDLGMESTTSDGSDNLYKALNQVLRDRNANSMRHLRPFLTHLMRGLRALPRVAGVFFRGVPNSCLDEVRRLYVVGQEVSWGCFTTVTKERTKAMNFAQGSGGVIFTITVLNGRCVLTCGHPLLATSHSHCSVLNTHQWLPCD